MCEWTRGATLKEVANTTPSPIGVADAMLSLAETADVVHGAGLALSTDHPERIRISVDGRVVLAFPATMPNTTPRDDLRGIGAVMYGLLVNRWPLRGEAATTDWESVEIDAQGRIQEPAVLNSRVPFLISSAAAGLVRDGDGIRSAKTISTLLREASDEAKNGAMPSATRRLVVPPPPGCYATFRNFGPTERAEYARRQLLKICLGTAAAYPPRVDELRHHNQPNSRHLRHERNPGREQAGTSDSAADVGFAVAPGSNATCWSRWNSKAAQSLSLFTRRLSR